MTVGGTDEKAMSRPAAAVSTVGCREPEFPGKKERQPLGRLTPLVEAKKWG